MRQHNKNQGINNRRTQTTNPTIRTPPYTSTNTEHEKRQKKKQDRQKIMRQDQTPKTTTRTTRQSHHPTTRLTHRNTSNNTEDLEESTDTNRSVQIDKHRTKESAADRGKAKAREKEIRHGSTASINALLPRENHPYVWGDKDDSTEDKEVEQNRLMEIVGCVNKAIRRSKLPQGQNEKESSHRQNITSTSQKQGSTTPDSMKDTSDSGDSEHLQKGRQVRQRTSKEQNRVRILKIATTRRSESNRSE